MASPDALHIILERRSNTIVVRASVGDTLFRENVHTFYSEASFDACRKVVNMECGEIVRMFIDISTIVIINNIGFYKA